MEVTARPATADDLDALSSLAADAVEERLTHKGGALWHRDVGRALPVGPSLRVDLDDPATHVVVGEIDGTPVGYGVVHVDLLRDGGRLGRITDLFTLPGAREVSVGEAVMDALLAWASAEGCFGVDSLALPGDRHTKNFFESFGLVARAIVVHKRLT